MEMSRKKHHAYQGKDLFGKSSKNITQVLGSAFLDRIRKNQISKNESDLFKMIDCFIDGYGSINSERVSFSNNF